MNFDQLNEIAMGANRTKVKFADLIENQLYEIESVRMVKTKAYGYKVIADLPDETFVFLPKRVGDRLLDNNEFGLKKFQSKLCESKIHLRRLAGSWNQMEFVVIPPEE